MRKGGAALRSTGVKTKYKVGVKIGQPSFLHAVSSFIPRVSNTIVAESDRMIEFEADPSFEKNDIPCRLDSRARLLDSERRAGTRIA